MQPSRSYVGGFNPQSQQQRVYQPSNQVAVMNRAPQQQVQMVGPNDPEAMMMMQIMQSMGSMGLPGFFGSGPMMSANPFDAFFDFSNLHQQLSQGGEEGTFVIQAQMTSIEMGPDGRPIIENYYENNLGQHMNGQTISEKQQAYRNTAGVNRIAEERMLNQQGRKIVKEKRGNEVEETNHYFNIDSEEAAQFDRNWERVNRENRFIEDHGRYLGYANCGPSMIEMGAPVTYQVSGPQSQVRAIGGPSSSQQAQSVQNIQQPSVQFKNIPMAQSIRSSTRPPVVGPTISAPSYNQQSSHQPNLQQANPSMPSSKLAQNSFLNKYQGQQSTTSATTLPHLYQPGATNNRS